MPRPRRPRRVVLLVAAALVVALGPLAAPPAPARAAGGPDWTVGTADDGSGNSRSSYTYTVEPGTTLEDAIVLANRGSSALDLRVRAADGFTTPAGRFDLRPTAAAPAPAGVGAWIRSRVDRVRLAAGGSATVPFTVRVPAGAPAGDYAGGVVTTLSGTDDDGQPVERRLGIRVALRVSGDLRPELTVGGGSITWTGGADLLARGAAVVSYTVRNTGNTAISQHQSVVVTGTIGSTRAAARSVAEVPQLLPRESWRVRVTVPGVVGLGPIGARATVTPIVVDAAGSTSPIAPVVVSTTGWAVPWATLALLAAAVALLGIVLLVRRRRRDRAEAGAGDAVQRTPDTSIPR